MRTCRSGGDATPILGTTNAALDHAATLVSLPVVSNALLAVGSSGDDSLDLIFLEPGAKRVGVISFIRNQSSDAGDQAHACFGHSAVGGIAGREYEYPRPALFVDNRVYLAVSAALGDAYRLRLGPPFPPLAQRWTFTWLLSSASCPGVSGSPATAVNIFCQMPRSHQRAKRL